MSLYARVGVRVLERERLERARNVASEANIQREPPLRVDVRTGDRHELTLSGRRRPGRRRPGRLRLRPALRGAGRLAVGLAARLHHEQQGALAVKELVAALVHALDNALQVGLDSQLVGKVEEVSHAARARVRRTVAPKSRVHRLRHHRRNVRRRLLVLARKAGARARQRHHQRHHHHRPLRVGAQHRHHVITQRMTNWNIQRTRWRDAEIRVDVGVIIWFRSGICRVDELCSARDGARDAATSTTAKDFVALAVGDDEIGQSLDHDHRDGVTVQE
eukprot:5571685-Pleurochrysis_carterae.AAC.2